MATQRNPSEPARLVDIVDDTGALLGPGVMGSVVLHVAVIDPDGRRHYERIRTGYRGFIESDGTLVLEEIPAGQRYPTYPASYRQQGLWLFEQLHSGTPAYNIAVSFSLRGSLHVGSLQRAVVEIARRHEVLRTTFGEQDGEPVQIVRPPGDVRVTLVDVTDRPEEARMPEVMEHIREESLRPFDLESGPLLRVRLYRLKSDDFVFQFVAHHIIFDAWSTGIFLTELSTLYNAFRQGNPAPLRDLPMQYSDFAIWQRERLQGGALATEINYWKRHLDGVPSHVNLPADRAAPPMPSFRGEAHNFTLSRALAERLTALARQEKGTLFMALLAGLYALLSRYSGQERLLVGVPVAGRRRTELEPLIGFFVNTLVLPGDLRDDPTFRETLRRTVEEAIGGYEHQEVPFAKLVAALQASRDLRNNGLVQVLFVYQNAPTGLLDLEGIEVEHVGVGSGTAQADLKLEMWESGDGLSCWFEYNTDLFDADTIARMATSFQSLLEEVARNPDQLASSIPLVSDDDIETIAAWNQTQAPYPDACLHTLVAEQARRKPDDVAIITADGTISRGELEARSTALARRMAAEDVRKGDIVGIFLETSPSAIIAILATLKVGAAYLPLDPAYPPDRLAFMLHDSGAGVVLTTAELASEVPQTGARVIRIGFHEEWEGRDAMPMFPESSLDDVAYVSYTSGSEGRPKGVRAPHRGAVNRLAWMWNQYPLQSSDVLCQRSSLNFVDHVGEVFGALAGGVPLVLPPPGSDKDPATLVAVLGEHKVTRVVLVPSLMRAILDSVPDLGSHLPALRFCHSSGEALDGDTMARFLTAVPHCRLLNLYGSSEVAADVACAELSHADEKGPVPIGRPIANTEAFVLDANRRPVPVGVMGELYVAGAGLARGYLNRPDLTEEKFVPHLIRPGERMYRTGDLARFRRDGVIEYHGRADSQVKIRGFRVEPGEIEAELARHPSVRECAVVARPGPDGGERLVAYAICTPDSSPTPSELHTHLRRALPAYMLPSAFVFLDAFPLTPSGKIDRRALPAPTEGRPDLRQAYVPATSPLERELTDIWSAILNVDIIGIHDDFFELGGHSLMATQVISRVRQRWEIDLPLFRLFSEPTVAGMCAALREAGIGDDGLPQPKAGLSEPASLTARWNDAQRALVPVRARGSKPPFIFIAGVNDAGFYTRRIAGLMDGEQPLFVVQPGRLIQDVATVDIPSLSEAVMEIVKGFNPDGPYYLGGYCNGGMLAFEVARRLASEGASVPLVLLLCTSANYPRQPLNAAPPLRKTVHPTSEPKSGLLRRWATRLYLPRSMPSGVQSQFEAQHNNRAEGPEEPMEAIGDAAAGLLPRVDLDRLMSGYRALLADPAGPKFGGKVTVFWPEEDAYETQADPSLGWTRAASQVEVQPVPGGHVTCITEHYPDMAARIQATLDRASSVSAGSTAPAFH